MINEEKNNDLIQKAFDFKNNEQFEASNEILEKVVADNPNHEKINGLMLALSGNYYELGLYEKAIDYSFKVMNNKPSIEMANLILYLSYYNIGDDEKAFMVLFAYLDKFEADLFKDTLEELLNGLTEGYGTSHRNEIIFYSKKNKVVIPDELIDD